MALHQLGMGVFCVSAHGRVIWANHHAEALMRQADGLHYSARTGLGCVTREATNALHRLIQRAAAGMEGALRVERRSGAPCLSVLAIPHRQNLENLRKEIQPRHVLLFINDPASPTSAQEQSVFASCLQAIYN